MEKTIRSGAGNPGIAQALPQGGFLKEELTFNSFVCSRLGDRLKKGSGDPISADELKRLMLSKDFKEGLQEIRMIAKAYDRGGASEGEREKLVNFAANVNAIVKNKELFEKLAGDRELKSDLELFGFAVSNAFPGAVRRAFEKVKGELPQNEQLTKEERKRMLGAIVNLK